MPCNAMFVALMHLLLNGNLAGLELDAFTKAQLAVLHVKLPRGFLSSALEGLGNDPALDGLICRSMFQCLEVQCMK